VKKWIPPGIRHEGADGAPRAVGALTGGDFRVHGAQQPREAGRIAIAAGVNTAGGLRRWRQPKGMPDAPSDRRVDEGTSTAPERVSRSDYSDADIPALSKGLLKQQRSSLEAPGR